MKIYLIGDIGGYTEITKKILKNINNKIEHDDVYFLLGDNFYPNGINDLSDSMWENIKLFGENMIYPILGNHDYLGSVKAQLDCNLKNWNLKNYYYKVTFDSIDFFFLDTSILQPNYSNLDYNIVKSKTDRDPIEIKNDMINWLKDELEKSNNKTIIIGHYPMISYGMYGINKNLMLDLLPIIRKYKVSYYISGHDHNLQIIDVCSEDFSFKQIISGASSFLYPILKNKSEKSFYSYGYVEIDTYLNKISIIDNNEKCLHKEDLF